MNCPCFSPFSSCSNSGTCSTPKHSTRTRAPLHAWGASIGGFGLVALLILAGQYLIITFGGKMFNVVPLSWTDWGLIFAGTSLVLWFGELARAFTPDKSGARS